MSGHPIYFRNSGQMEVYDTNTPELSSRQVFVRLQDYRALAARLRECEAERDQWQKLTKRYEVDLRLNIETVAEWKKAADDLQANLAAAEARIAENDKWHMDHQMDVLVPNERFDELVKAEAKVRALEALIKQAVSYPINANQTPLPRWACVRNMFGLGSTRGTQLCKDFGVNPDDEIDGHPCQVCEDEQPLASRDEGQGSI
jgi:hypothetical protein